MPEFDIVYGIMTALFIGVFLIMAIFMIVMMLRTLRAPKVYYLPPARELIGQLMCPKCGSRDLEAIGYYTLRCKSCGFTFRVGAERLGGFYFWPLMFPIFWPMAFWWPVREK